MAKNLSFYEEIKEGFQLNNVDSKTYSPIVLAYIGDAVLEVIIRTIVTNEHINKVSNINKISSDYVKATTQAKIVRYLLDKEYLSDEEKAVYKRGRNANSLTTAKHAKLSEYKMSTGFEALLGFHYLNHNMNRIIELIRLGIEYIDHSAESDENENGK